jgi:hypothetical protein
MDVRDFIAASAAEFSRSLRDWLSIPSVSADPADHGGLDAHRIHAPNEYVDLSRPPHGAKSVAYLWEELAGAHDSAPGTA